MLFFCFLSTSGSKTNGRVMAKKVGAHWAQERSRNPNSEPRETITYTLVRLVVVCVYVCACLRVLIRAYVAICIRVYECMCIRRCHCVGVHADLHVSVRLVRVSVCVLLCRMSRTVRVSCDVCVLIKYTCDWVWPWSLGIQGQLINWHCNCSIVWELSIVQELQCSLQCAAFSVKVLDHGHS